MFNLIRKDIVLQKKTLAVLFLGLCVYLTLDVSPIWVGIAFSIAIFMNAISIDEKSSIHMLLNSLPYTRKEIVSSKYIVVVLFTCMVAAAIYRKLHHSPGTYDLERHLVNGCHCDDSCFIHAAILL
ncbi:ABC-2 transporter permease [Bacillus haynesii]|nr:ABC-2 transporter permease [Bacillus haynesii]MEC1446936.1 ABC-2 transporter permease [Bacillus haynesii]